MRCSLPSSGRISRQNRSASFARRGRPAQLLAYSGADAATLKTCAAEFADPMAFAALAIDTLASKAMPEFAAGRRLAFSTRLRPTVRTDRGTDRNKVREIDAFVAAQAAAPGRRWIALPSISIGRIAG